MVALGACRAGGRRFVPDVHLHVRLSPKVSRDTIGRVGRGLEARLPGCDPEVPSPPLRRLGGASPAPGKCNDAWTADGGGAMEAYPRRPWERRDGLVAAGAMKTPLAWIGAFALLLWTGGGLVAWALAKERVSLVVEQGERERIPAEDGLAELSRRIDEQAEERRALGRGARAELRRPRRALRGPRGRARAGARRRAGRGRRDRARPGGDARGARAGERARGQRGRRSRGPERARRGRDGGRRGSHARARGARRTRWPTAAEPGSERGAAPELPRLPLPEDDFRFDERRSWVVVPSQSRVGFDAKSTLHDFSGTTSQVAGELAFDLSRPDEDPRGEIHVEAAGLDTGNADRDQDMRQHLDTAGHPELRFRLERFAPATIDAEQAAVHGTAHGNDAHPRRGARARHARARQRRREPPALARGPGGAVAPRLRGPGAEQARRDLDGARGGRLDRAAGPARGPGRSPRSKPGAQ